MFYFNLFVILPVDFRVYFGLLLSKRTRLEGSSEKKGHIDRKLWGGGGADAPSAPEGLIYGYLERDNEKVFKLYVNNFF